MIPFVKQYAIDNTKKVSLARSRVPIFVGNGNNFDKSPTKKIFLAVLIIKIFCKIVTRDLGVLS